MNMFSGPKVPSGPSAEELAQREAAAAEKERARIAQEEAASKAKKQQEADTALAERESKRKAFVGQLEETGDEDERRKFLRAV